MLEAIKIRQLNSADMPALNLMHDRLSEKSIHYRYLRSFRPSEQQLQELIKLTVERGYGFVATIGEQIVGMAFYIVETNAQLISAEPAFLVEDAFQGQGIGRRLWQRLSQHASVAGIQQLNAYVHPSNGAMLNLFRSSGYPIKSGYAYGMAELSINLAAEMELYC